MPCRKCGLTMTYRPTRDRMHQDADWGAGEGEHSVSVLFGLTLSFLNPVGKRERKRCINALSCIELIACPVHHHSTDWPTDCRPQVGPGQNPQTVGHTLSLLSLSATLPKWYCTVHFSVPLVLFEDPSMRIQLGSALLLALSP